MRAQRSRFTPVARRLVQCAPIALFALLLNLAAPVKVLADEGGRRSGARRRLGGLRRLGARRRRAGGLWSVRLGAGVGLRTDHRRSPAGHDDRLRSEPAMRNHRRLAPPLWASSASSISRRTLRSISPTARPTALADSATRRPARCRSPASTDPRQHSSSTSRGWLAPSGRVRPCRRSRPPMSWTAPTRAAGSPARPAPGRSARQPMRASRRRRSSSPSTAACWARASSAANIEGDVDRRSQPVSIGPVSIGRVGSGAHSLNEAS